MNLILILFVSTLFLFLYLNICFDNLYEYIIYHTRSVIYMSNRVVSLFQTFLEIFDIALYVL